jgi:protein-disulfide isomerase
MIMPFLRSVAAAAIFCAAPSLGPTFGQSLSLEQKQDFEQLIHDYIVNHPEVVTQALEALRARAEAEQAKAASATIDARHGQLLSDPGSPVDGNPKGDVTLVEFFDYRCPSTRNFPFSARNRPLQPTWRWPPDCRANTTSFIAP